MANWPTISPETFEDVNQNPRVIELVTRMIEATHDYLQEWDAELSELHNEAVQSPIETLTNLANSIQEVADQLQLFRAEGVEIQSEHLAEFMRQSEEAFQDLQEQTEGAG